MDGKSAIATLVERNSRFLITFGLPEGKKAAGLAEVLINRGYDLPVYFAHPHSPWERPSNENTNGLIREYLPKGIELTSRQPYPDSIADGLDRPRPVLGFLTPREVFPKLLNEDISKTA